MNCFLHSSNIKCSFLLLLWQQRSMVWHIIGLAKKQQEQKNEESFRRSKKSGIHSHKLVHAFSTHYEKKSDGGARTRTLTLGVPTFKKISSYLAEGWICQTIFHEDFKNVNFINVGQTPSTHKFCPAQFFYSWAVFMCWRGLSDWKIKKGTFVKIEKLSFWESPVKIR